MRDDLAPTAAATSGPNAPAKRSLLVGLALIGRRRSKRARLRALTARCDSAEARLAAHDAMITRTASVSQQLSIDLAALSARSELLGRDLAEVSTLAHRLGRDSASTWAHTEALYADIAAISRRAAKLAAFAESADAWSELGRYSAWTAGATLQGEPRISVVMATRNRALLARRAIDSLLGQTYSNWELHVVDDGSEDDTLDMLHSIDDPRVQVHHVEAAGSAAARNVGLGAASGEVVVFLDDDNLMAPDWLHSVAAAFSRSSDLQVAYGAQLRAGERPEDPPWLLFHRTFDREALIAANYIDLGALAVRAGTPELQFDPDLPALQDWDLVLRLSREVEPVPIPVLAGRYTHDAPNRISTRSDVAEIAARVQARHSRTSVSDRGR